MIPSKWRLPAAAVGKTKVEVAKIGGLSEPSERVGSEPWLIAMPRCCAICSAFTKFTFATCCSSNPFSAPIVMYTRLIIGSVPVWQVALSIVLMIAAIIGGIWLCARIYRVGVLMYGKKPNLPEIIRWIKYA